MKKLFLLLFFIFLITPLAVFSQQEVNNPVLPSEIGQVISVENMNGANALNSENIQNTKQSVEIKITKGAHKGEKVFVENMLTGNPAYDISLKSGDKIILHAESENGSVNFFIADKQRSNVLYGLCFVFFALLLIIGRKKGFFSLISILITLGLIFWMLAPMILGGFNPIFATVLTCVIASVIAIYLVGGINPKSTAAILGTVFSLVIAGFLSTLTIKLAGLTGFSSEESMFLFTAHPELNFIGILASSMLIGALGAVMDIGMSISSTINELFSSCDNEMTTKELFTSGMNVGKDIIGTMANTLILAYLGGALGLVLLANNIDLQKFFNLNQVATEISSAVIGSIAIVICVPITAIIAAYLIKKLPPKTME